MNYITIKHPDIKGGKELFKDNIIEMYRIKIGSCTKLFTKKEIMKWEKNEWIIKKNDYVGEKEIRLEEIKEHVCNVTDIHKDAVEMKTRKREIVKARQLICFFAKEYTDKSLSVIGDFIGKFDHTTVLHGVKTIKNLYETDKETKKQVNELTETFENLNK